MTTKRYPLLFIPLDDRPCCLDLVLRLASLVSENIRIPPRASLGHFKQPGNPRAILDWLESQPSAAPLIASLDMLSWGGLIASRDPQQDKASAESHFQRFLDLQRHRSGTTYAFKTLLRTTPTQTTVEEIEQAEQIVALSRLGYLKDKLQKSAQNYTPIQSAITQLEQNISPTFLERYLAVRQRNHSFDRLVVRSASALDALLFAIDDSQTEGWNLLEKERLQDLADRHELSVDFYPGTDESAQLLLARMLGQEAGIEPIWSHHHLPLTQTRYEDRPLGALLQSQLQASRLRQGRCRRKLFLYGRPGAQLEANHQGGPIKPIEQENLTGFLDRLETALDAGDSCVIADLAFANGGDLHLVNGLLERGLASRLTGYSAWNTAGNTLGTALAILALYPEEPSAEQEHIRRLLLWERLTDDAFYQSRFRFLLKKEVGPGLCLSADDLITAESLLTRDFHEVASHLWTQLFPDEPLQPFKLTLPWGRLFEVAIRPAA